MSGASLLRLLTSADVQCPAGEALGDADCYCGVEQDIIPGRKNPRTIELFCTSCYTDCPSWRAHKEAVWADKARYFDRAVDRGEDPTELVGPEGGLG